jgi:hypothetical protein
MGYRDDLEAALERADTLEHDLARAKSAADIDHEHIADLERQLKEARAKAPRQREEKPARSFAPLIITSLLLLGAIVAAAVIVFASASPTLKAAARPDPPAPPMPPPANGFDVSTGLKAALAMAQQKFSDAQLVRINAEYVDPAGIAELNYGGEVRYRFASPSRAAQPKPTAPVLGAPAVADHVNCRVSIWADKNKPLRLGSFYSSDCSETLPAGSPHCTVGQVWQRAIARGAPDRALATVELSLRDGTPRWHFQIYDQARNQSVSDMKIPDDCN